MNDRERRVEERRADEEADAAAAEAGQIGGRSGMEGMEEAERAAAEHGGGEAEGFEEAEELLEEQASHGDAAGDPLADAPEAELEDASAAYGDPDTVESTETRADTEGVLGERHRPLRIGIVGSGHIGGTLARHFVEHGHEVAVSNSRGPETLRELVAELGDGARALSPEEAAKFGDVVVVSVPFGRYREIPVGEMSGKVVIDTNNYYPERDGHYEQLDDDSTTSSEMLADRLRGRVVKAFNAIRWDRLRDMDRPESGPDDRVGIPISGDDAEAKRTVAGLIDEIGFTAVDAGSLGEGGRKHQPGTPVYTADLPAGELRARIAA